MIDVHSPPEDNLNTSNKDIINIPDWTKITIDLLYLFSYCNHFD